MALKRKMPTNISRLNALLKRLEKKEDGSYMDNDLKAILTLKDIFQIEEARLIANVSSASDANKFDLINKIKRIIEKRISSFEES